MPGRRVTLLAVIAAALSVRATAAADINVVRRIIAPAVPGGLHMAQQRARGAIASALAEMAAEGQEGPAREVQVVLSPGIHPLDRPLRLGPEDSGVAGLLRVRWLGATTDPSNSSVVDGGVLLTGWQSDSVGGSSGQPVGAGDSLLYAVAPPALRNATGEWLPVRNLWINGVRYNRTSVPGASVGFPDTARMVAGGFETNSTEPLMWANPESVEVVSDHTWVQHRCRVTSVERLAPAAPAVARPRALLDNASCAWTPKVAGHSPGSSLKQLNGLSYEECQQACCDALPACEAIISAGSGGCFLLDRKYEGNFQPEGGDTFVADLNCTPGAKPVCQPPPPPPVMHVRINISSPCFELASGTGSQGMKLSSVSHWENVGMPQAPGEWFFDMSKGRFYIWPLPAARDATGGIQGVAAAQETLVELADAHDITWSNVTFAHAAWFRAAAPEGFAERYGGVLFQPAPGGLVPSHAAVTISASRDIFLDGCAFRSLGAWAVRLGNGSQSCGVSASSFRDLSGGAICLGDVDDSAEVAPQRQMAYLTVADNTVDHVGVEYKGAPGIHTFCIRDSVIEHNRITRVGYTGISYNWPDPQGPTFGPGDGGPGIGYSSGNSIRANDVSRFMSYMNDGGGIHTIGRSYKTNISHNYFHDIAAGTSCAPGVPCHSGWANSIIYIDNWSMGFDIVDNVVADANRTRYGWLFFQGEQGGHNGLAHDNTGSGNFICNAGQDRGYPAVLNATGTFNVTACQQLPAAALDIIRAAGPRTTLP